MSTSHTGVRSVLSEPSENAVVVAIDHGQHFGVYDRFENPRETLETVLSADPDGIIAGVPFLQQFEETLDTHPSVSRIATIDLLHESTFPGESEEAEIHTQVFSVRAAARAGADAIKAALVYGREEPAVLQSNIKFVAHAAEEATEAGLPMVIEPTLWGSRADDEFHAERLANANRIGLELGASILKSPYPGDPAQFAQIPENAPVPVLIAGGPAVESDERVLEMVHGAVSRGARGVMIGRNIWQHPDPASMITAMQRIVHDGDSVEEAKEALR